MTAERHDDPRRRVAAPCGGRSENCPGLYSRSGLPGGGLPGMQRKRLYDEPYRRMDGRRDVDLDRVGVLVVVLLVVVINNQPKN